MEAHPGSPVPTQPLSALLRNDNEFGVQALLNASKCIQTGFPALDQLLGGGLSPGLIVLGASPGLGKSTLALNIAEYASQHGTPVRYYSYEMPPKRLGMKLIARQNFCAGGRPLFSARDLFDAARISTWSDGWQAYQTARDQVAQRIDQLYIVDCYAGGKAYTAEDIQTDFQLFMQQQNPQGVTPLLIVDYLQILPLEPSVRISDARQAVDYNVRKMTSLSKSFGGVPVLLISSLGRTSYKVPVQIDSFKESGSIEFSADTLLGLQFSACQNEDGSPNKDWNMAREKDQIPRKMDLVVLKQRYGATGRLPFLYYAPYDCFTQPDIVPASSPQIVQESDEQFTTSASTAPLFPAPPSPTATPDLRPANSLTGRTTSPAPSAPSLEKAYINNTMIAHSLRSGTAVPGEETVCKVIPAKEIETTFCISSPLASNDCDVADALYSLFLTEKYFSKADGFTLRRLLTILTGDSLQTLSAQKREELLASLARLQQTTLSIQCSQELEARSMGEKYQALLLETPRPFLQLHQHEEKYYFPSVELVDVLPLYEYATMTGQIIAFPTKLLDVRAEDGKKGLRNTAVAVTIKHFLIYRLEVVRNKKGASIHDRMRTVSFTRSSQLFHLLRMRREDYSNAAWTLRCRRIREAVVTTLEYFKRIHYIQDYTTRDEASITITGPISDPWTLEYD